MIVNAANMQKQNKQKVTQFLGVFTPLLMISPDWWGSKHEMYVALIGLQI